MQKARDRAHILIGLRVAVNEIDEVIALIKGAKDTAEAREELMRRDWDANVVQAMLALIQDRGNRIENGRFYFTEVQARAMKIKFSEQHIIILNYEEKMKELIYFISNRNINRKISDEELKELSDEISEYLKILSDPFELTKIVKEELMAITPSTYTGI